MTKKKLSSVFLSHSSIDKPFVRKLATAFEKHGIKAWVDEGEIKVGDSLSEHIENGIRKADYFAIVLSKNSISSAWVTAEFKAAFILELENKIRVLPIVIDDVEVPLFLKDKLYGDFKNPKDFNKSFQALLNTFIEHPSKRPDPFKTDKPAAKLYPNHFLPDLKFFVGREELLKLIRETLDKNHRAAIHDISGLGKTFTAYKFAHNNQGNYDHIFFIRATREEMLESLAKCGELVEAGLVNIQKQEDKALGFKQWLEENENWLVIYDNVDLPGELFPFVPVSKKGDCLFTSNFKEVINLVTSDCEIRINKLDKSDAGILLFSRAEKKPYSIPKFENAEDEAAFHALVEEIDGLPLTLNSTGAFISEGEMTFSEFRKLFEAAPNTVWTTEDDFSTYKNRQQKSAGKVFSLVYDELCKVKETGKAVKTILDSVSFISPDEIPADLLLEILKKQYKPFLKKDSTELFWNEIRKSLTAYDLLKYDKHKKTFTTHRAIQRVIQSTLKGEEKDICITLASVLRGLFPIYDYSNREECEKYYQHVIVLLENAKKSGAETDNTNELYFRAGSYQRLLGNYTLAENFHLHAAEISASVAGPKSKTHARDLNDLANVYHAQGRYNEAIEKYEEAMRIDEKALGCEHPEYAIRLNNLAVVYKYQGRYDEAIEKFEEALRIGEKTIGREHPSYATLNNLAIVYQMKARYDEAIEKFEEALRIQEKTIGREHPDYASGLANLANVYSAQGKYDEAIEKYEEAFRIDETTIGHEHPIYATRLNNLGDIYRLLGRYDEAIEKHEKALEIRRKTLGNEHPDYAQSLNNLALVYEEQGKFPEALDLYKTALRIFEKTLPEGHPYIVQLRECVERCEKLVNRVD